MPDLPKMDHNISEERFGKREERFEKRQNARSYPNSGNNSPTRHKKMNHEEKGVYTNEYSANEGTRKMDQGSKTDAKIANKTNEGIRQMEQGSKTDAKVANKTNEGIRQMEEGSKTDAKIANKTNEGIRQMDQGFRQMEQGSKSDAKIANKTNEGIRQTDQGSKTDAKFENKTKPQKLSPPNKNISDAFSRQSPKGSRMPSNSEPATPLQTGVSKGTSNHTKNNSQGGLPGSGTSSRSDSLESTSSNIRPHTGGDVRWDAVNMALKSGPLNLSHFRLLKRIGYGDIGSVYLVELKGTDAHFAMKVMDKAALISRNKLLRSQTEREILGLLDHPFLPTLYSYFETDKFYCLVMEYCSGGDLHSLRQKQPNKCFTEEAARFYASEVLLALEYLHMLGIVYRDLKPENLLVRDEGHIMLSDFDLSLRCSVSPTLVKSSSTHAGNGSGSDSGGIFNDDQAVQGTAQTSSSFFPRILPSKKNRKAKSDFGLLANGNRLPELMAEPTNVRSMSFVGTHEYLAPEIIKGEGHGSAVDWWTFGIFLYELLHGATPFKGSGYKATLFNVVGQPLRFPDNPQISQVAKDLIRGLLIKEPQKRIAYKRGATEIKQHPFFEGVNWALVRSAMPPHIPDVIDFSKYARKETAPPPVDKKLPDNASDKKCKNSTDNSYVDFEYF